MISKEGAIRKFIQQYEIEVPQELVEEEFKLCILDMKHKLVYGQMTGSSCMNPLEQAQALEEAQEELREVAYHTVKEDLVMRELLKQDRFRATAKELEAYGQAMAQRQKTSMEMIRKFFGKDLHLLESDVRRQKADAWIYEQMTAEA